MIINNSPFDNVPVLQWKSVTQKLLSEFPLDKDYLISVTLKSWDNILKTKIADKLSIAYDVQPKPQIMGFFLHEVIAHSIQTDYPSFWRKENDSSDKDVVCIENPLFSFEIKTSSHKNKIFGNRSYAQESNYSKKSKSGYYLAINFEKFGETQDLPRIRLIRFGWIDHSDWSGQNAATGQQASLSKEVETGKLIELYKI